MARRARLDRAGVRSILKSDEFFALVEAVAEEVADYARADAPDVDGIPGDIELPIEVDVYETDRAAAAVILAHPAGIAVQAKHGLLTRAAARAGLEVSGDAGRDLVQYTSRAGRVSIISRAQAENYGGSYKPI